MTTRHRQHLLFSLGIAALSFSAARLAFPQASDPAHKTTYYLHGRIYTNDPKQPWASAMAVRDEKIFCIGSIEHILLDCGGSKPEAEIVQLKGRFVMPGFNDAHTHLGGAIERDAEGNPTGMFKEGSAMEFVVQKIPEPTEEARRHGIELVLQELARNGVTSAQDNSAWEDFLVYHQLKEEKKLTARITEWLPFMAPLNELQNMRSEGGTTDPWLRTGTLKMVTDGALGSRTAALLAPYSDEPNTSGIMTIQPEKLKAMALS